MRVMRGEKSKMRDFSPSVPLSALSPLAGNKIIEKYIKNKRTDAYVSLEHPLITVKIFARKRAAKNVFLYTSTITTFYSIAWLKMRGCQNLGTINVYRICSYYNAFYTY
jgi:hypothetical protein